MFIYVHQIKIFHTLYNSTFTLYNILNDPVDLENEKPFVSYLWTLIRRISAGFIRSFATLGSLFFYLFCDRSVLPVHPEIYSNKTET